MTVTDAPTTAARAALRWVVRNSLVRPVAATRAAAQLRHGLALSVSAEIRWAFQPPRAWLVGVAVNLALALAWLAVQPLETGRHRDWVIVVGTYFASFILADVTTTNVLGVDRVRVEAALTVGASPWRIVLVKNLALLAIVGAPTMAVAVALTLATETPARLEFTVPEVAVPMLSWLGVGNVVSVLLPVAYEPLIRRWRQRHDGRRVATWLAHLVLPYGLLYLCDPVYGLPKAWFWGRVPMMLHSTLGPDADRGLVHVAVAVGVWLAGLTIAHVVIRRRGLRWH